MNFHEGDTVMHWTYGLGKVMRLEERDLSGSIIPYYAVKVREMTVWVPADGNLGSRLRFPTSPAGFKRLLTILSGPGEPIPEDRQERRTHFLELFKDGRAESLCKVIRDLSVYQKSHKLNDNDQSFLKQARRAMLAEWEFVRSITPEQAELELHRILQSEPAGNSS